MKTSFFKVKIKIGEIKIRCLKLEHPEIVLIEYGIDWKKSITIIIAEKKEDSN